MRILAKILEPNSHLMERMLKKSIVPGTDSDSISICVGQYSSLEWYTLEVPSFPFLTYSSDFFILLSLNLF